MTLRSYHTEFVGRADELIRLDQALAAVHDGTPAVILLGGEAGVGKTRLASEFAGRARAAGARVLAGGCVDMSGGGLPYGPVVEALRELPHDGSVFGPDRAEFAWLLPFGDEQSRDQLREHGEVSGGIGQLRLFEWLLRLFRRLGEEAPVVLVMEDLHWASSSTLDLLSFLVTNVRHERFLLLATYRDDEQLIAPLRAFLAELSRGPGAQRIELARFDRDELAALLAGVLRREPEGTLVDRIFVQSDGNAFFAEELVAAGADAEGNPLPAALRDILSSRVEALSEPAQETLRALAVCGRRVEHDVLARVSDLRDRELIRALREMLTEKIILTDADGLYLFRHALAHEAVYAGLLAGERMRLHARVAAALADRATGTADPTAAADPTADPTAPADPTLAAEIAHHWYEARDYPRALAAVIESARLTTASMFAFGDADRQYERALQLWDQVPTEARPPGASKVDLLREAAEAARWVGDTTRAIELVELALSMVDPQAEPAQAGMLCQRLAMYLWEAGEGTRSTETYERASELLSGEALSTERAWMLADRGAMLMLGSHYRQARECCEEALRVARQAGARDAEVHLRNTLGYSMVMLGEHDEGIARLRDALAQAHDDHDIEAVCRAYTNLATVLPLVGQHEEALRLADEGLAMMRRLGLELTAGGVLLGITAATLFRLGRWARAEALTKEVLDRPAPDGLALFAHVTRVELDTARGRWEEAQHSLKLAHACAHDTTDPMAMAHLLAATAELAIWQGDHHAARSAVALGLHHLTGTEEEHLVVRLCALGLRAEADEVERLDARHGRAASRDEPADCRRVGGRLFARAREAAARPSAAFAEAQANALTCHAEYARLRLRADPAAWQRAAVGWEKLNFPAPAGYARFRQAEAAASGRTGAKASAGGRPTAATALRAARAHAAALADAPAPLLTEIDLLARRARIDLKRPVPAPARPNEPPDPFRLTRRERQVLTLLVQGCTNREIARALFITEKTASVHVSNIMKKMQTENRAKTAAAAHRLGLA